MFLGLIGKGFALMGLLIVTLFLIILYSDSTGMYWITAYLIPTLCVLFLSYAVFDAMAIADAQRSGREAARRGRRDDEGRLGARAPEHADPRLGRPPGRRRRASCTCSPSHSAAGRSPLFSVSFPLNAPGHSRAPPRYSVSSC